MSSTRLSGIEGRSGARPVLIGFEKANVLFNLSFADVLDEDTRQGYQRRLNDRHSLDFRKYIQKQNSTTIPLTFNLRASKENSWSFKKFKNGRFELFIRNSEKKYLSQVDCQHRLGHMFDIDVELPFMIYIGLSIKEEMEVFNVINSKAKGLNTSLLDYHQTQLEENLIQNKPELFYAMQLNELIESPWYKQLDLGGNKTIGMNRRASFRTMQKAIKKFLSNISDCEYKDNEVLEFIINFWKSIHFILNIEWVEPRKHIINKGIGVYSLMELASDIFIEASKNNVKPDAMYLNAQLSDFLNEIDWSNKGQFKGLGGQAGVKEAIKIIRNTRGSSTRIMSIVEHGK